ncbi:hypothetical protein Nmel_016050 [Mimus melanotis]
MWCSTSCRRCSPCGGWRGAVPCWGSTRPTTARCRRSCRRHGATSAPHQPLQGC